MVQKWFQLLERDAIRQLSNRQLRTKKILDLGAIQFTDFISEVLLTELLKFQTTKTVSCICQAL